MRRAADDCRFCNDCLRSLDSSSDRRWSENCSVMTCGIQTSGRLRRLPVRRRVQNGSVCAHQAVSRSVGGFQVPSPALGRRWRRQRLSGGGLLSLSPGRDRELPDICAGVTRRSRGPSKGWNSSLLFSIARVREGVHLGPALSLGHQGLVGEPVEASRSTRGRTTETSRHPPAGVSGISCVRRS